jgi:hypothetical protein
VKIADDDVQVWGKFELREWVSQPFEVSYNLSENHCNCGTVMVTDPCSAKVTFKGTVRFSRGERVGRVTSDVKYIVDAHSGGCDYTDESSIPGSKTQSIVNGLSPVQ